MFNPQRCRVNVIFLCFFSRWFFEALEYPKFSKANVINGILMTVVFFIVRIAPIPPFYSYIYSVFGTEAYIRLGLLRQSAWIDPDTQSASVLGASKHAGGLDSPRLMGRLSTGPLSGWGKLCNPSGTGFPLL